MAHYDDLGPCDYFGAGLSNGPLLAVGWLEPEYPYTTGDPGRDVYRRLQEFAATPAWQPIAFFGSHQCRLGSCRYGSMDSHLNIFLPGHNVVYVAPEGILHYISCHDYLPPSEFCAAVLASPSEGSPEYFEALQASGFRVDSRLESESIRRSGVQAIVEARGRAMVEALETFRKIHGLWPHTLDEALGLVDDAGTWSYALERGEFTLETDWRARENFALRYHSSAGVWNYSSGGGQRC